LYHKPSSFGAIITTALQAFHKPGTDASTGEVHLYGRFRTSIARSVDFGRMLLNHSINGFRLQNIPKLLLYNQHYSSGQGMVLKRTRSKGLAGVNPRDGMFYYLRIHFRPFLTPKSTANWGFGTFPSHFSL